MKKHLLTLLFPVLLIISCGKNDDKPGTTLDQHEVSLNYDQTHQFKISEGGTALDASKVTWTSSDIHVGTIDAAGLFTAHKIGTTTIKAVTNGSTLTSEVTVIPYSELCVEPITEFGISLATVKSREKRAMLEQTTTALLYKGENPKVLNVIYSFNASALESSILLFSPTSEVVEESARFFAERYPFVGESEDIFFFEDAKTTLSVGYFPELGFVAVYFPRTEMADGLSGSADKTEKLRMLKKAFLETRNTVELITAK